MAQKNKLVGYVEKHVAGKSCENFKLADILCINLCHMLLIRQNSNAEETEQWQSLWLCVVAEQPSVEHLISR